MSSESRVPSPASRAPIAVLIPCYNEEITIGAVVRQFLAELPNAVVCVCDNNSTDTTREQAKKAGARVIFEPRQGKGFAVQALFRSVDADLYVMVDGDGTYPAKAVHQLLEPILQDQADMVIGSRLHKESQSQFRGVNKLGNRIFLSILNSLYNARVTDLLSGYRAFSRRFVKRLPLFGGGFEIETELTMKALQRGYRYAEVPVNLTSRPEGSQSKIRVVHDGFIILYTIIALFRDHKPLTFFGSAGICFGLLGLVLMAMLLLNVFPAHSSLYPILTIVAVVSVVLGMLVGLAGLILHTIVRRFQELDHLLSVGMKDEE